MEGLVSYLKCQKNGEKQPDFAVCNIYYILLHDEKGATIEKRNFYTQATL